MRFLVAVLATGCSFETGDTTDDTDDTDDTAVGCVEPRLDWWCFHSEGEPGPVIPDTGMATCDVPSDAGAVACGPYTVVTETGGFSGIEHYFLDGDHVATKYWTDVNSYCGGFVFWYGEAVECAVP